MALNVDRRLVAAALMVVATTAGCGQRATPAAGTAAPSITSALSGQPAPNRQPGVFVASAAGEPVTALRWDTTAGTGTLTTDAGTTHARTIQLAGTAVAAGRWDLTAAGSPAPTRLTVPVTGPAVLKWPDGHQVALDHVTDSVYAQRLARAG